MTASQILVVDDDETFNAVLVRALGRRGVAARGVTSAEAALRAVAEAPPERVVLDLNLAGESGLNLIAPILAANPDCRIVVLTGYASIATAVDAIKLGAAQYLAKPVEVEAVIGAFAHQPAADAAPPEATPLSVDRLEWEHIQRVLREHDGNISATARALKMHRRTLQRKLSKHPVRQ
ncbi:MAG: response regulator [Rhodocyclaceae bacterium]|nr:response regulator [Rhodocyclaceae bacterium]